MNSVYRIKPLFWRHNTDDSAQYYDHFYTVGEVQLNGGEWVAGRGHFEATFATKQEAMAHLERMRAEQLASLLTPLSPTAAFVADAIDGVGTGDLALAADMVAEALAARPDPVPPAVAALLAAVRGLVAAWRGTDRDRYFEAFAALDEATTEMAMEFDARGGAAVGRDAKGEG